MNNDIRPNSFDVIPNLHVFEVDTFPVKFDIDKQLLLAFHER